MLIGEFDGTNFDLLSKVSFLVNENCEVQNFIKSYLWRIEDLEIELTGSKEVIDKFNSSTNQLEKLLSQEKSSSGCWV